MTRALLLLALSVRAQAVKKSLGSSAEANKLVARLSSHSAENKAETVKKDLPAAIDALPADGALVRLEK